MEQIEHQRVTAHPAQRRADRPAQRREASAAHEVVEEVPRPEQKQPGQQREIVGRVKPVRREALFFDLEDGTFTQVVLDRRP